MAAASDLTVASLAELSEMVGAGTVSAVELLAAHLDRIDALDESVRAILEHNPWAAEDAAALDEERRRSGARSPLHGVPVLVKGNIDVDTPGMCNTAGSLALLDTPVRGDAACVERLRAAGAVILGTANLSEWANFRGMGSSSGWSARGGQTRNPHVLDRSPCGSSSGSAAAVAARFVPVAIGTETDGSVVCPSAMCGVAGIKPTLGLVDTRGVIPIAPSQDVVGTHGRTVADAALLLAHLAAPGALPAAPWRADPSVLAGVRIGVLRQQFAGFSRLADVVLETACAALRDAGAVLIDPVLLATAEELKTSEAEMVVLRHEFRAALDAYLAERADPVVGSLAQLIAFNTAHADEELAHFGQELLQSSLEAGGLDDPAYLAARGESRRLAATEGVDAAMTEHGVEVLLSLTAGPPWAIDPVCGDHVVGGSSQLAAVAGYPAVTIPAGVVAGALPVGVTLSGRAGADARVIAIAAAAEALLGARVDPGFLPTLPAA